MPGCGKKCGKEKKRQSRASRKSQDKYVETEFAPEIENTTDPDLILSDATEYQTIPGTASDRSKPRRKNQKNKSQRIPEKTPRKPKKIPESIHDGYSTERSYTSTPSGKNIDKKRKTPYGSSTEEDDSSDQTMSSSKCATVNLSKFLGGDSTESGSFEDDGDDGRGCEDDECGGGRMAVRTRRKKLPSDEESSDDESYSSSEKCPELCEYDPTKLPEEKPKKCDSYCRRLEWLEKQRDRKQAEMDDYLLRKGLRYFDDMCKCSLKCIMSQVYVDPFVRNIAFSTIGFLLGVKLCWELDGFYVIF